MREHLQSTGYLQAPTHGSNHRDPSGNDDDDDDSSYSATFRELFCITAHEIAKTLDTSLQNLGCLYEDVLATGTVMNRAIWTSNHGNKTILAADVVTAPKDVEAGVVNPILFGRGQLLVLTRKVDKAEARRLKNLGYSFANVQKVSDHLARSLQIPRNDIENLVDRLQAFCDRKLSMPEKGTYLASFLVQPRAGMRGIDVVVPRATPHQLPMVKLSDEELDSRQLSILLAFDGLTLDDCLIHIHELSTAAPSSPADGLFLDKFRNRIVDLVRDCPEQALGRATFSALQVDMVHDTLALAESHQATVFAFCGIRDFHSQSLQSPTLKMIPMSFFQAYLRSQAGCADHAILAQRNHKEFSSLQRTRSIQKPAPSKAGGMWRGVRSKRSASTDICWKADTCSEKGLVSVSQSVAEPSTHAWGGIMVTSTQDIHVNEPKDSADLEMRELGVKAKIGIQETEQQTLADRLMATTTAFRDAYTTRPLPRDVYYGGQR
jgi:hypothetical protein